MDEKIKIFTVNVNKTAKNDLREIIRYISKNNPMNALNVIKRIQDRINSLDHFP
jgi:plasmid stabilization system protein ParE